MVPRDKQRRAVKSRVGIINRRNRDGERESESLRSHPVRVCATVDGHRNNTGRLGIINRRNRDGRRKTEKSSFASCARVCDRRWTP